MSQAMTFQQHRFGRHDQRLTCSADTKIVFETLVKAQAHADRISQRTNKVWSAYLSQCGWYHVTSKSVS